YMGFTLNVITLLALALVVGIVIDDAVVVLENIFRNLEERKISAMQAAKEGTAEIALAVLATTLSLIAVFLPVAFMGGIVGRFMNSFGVTMACAVAVSLLVSFTLTPMLASRWLESGKDGKDAKDGKDEGEDTQPGFMSHHATADAAASRKGIYRHVERAYLGLLGMAL